MITGSGFGPSVGDWEKSCALDADPQPYRRSLCFESEAIEIMTATFQRACAALRVVAGDERGGEIVAGLIIDLARNAVIDVAALYGRLIAEAR